MIYVTGDTHRRTDFLKLGIFADNLSCLTKDDFAIIDGDFGARS